MTAPDSRSVTYLCLKGTARRIAGDLDAAYRLLSEALTLAEDGSPDAATVHNELGILRKAQGECAEALAHYRIAMSVFRRAPDEHRAAIASLYHNLAGSTFMLGQIDVAVELARQGIAIRSELADPDGLALLLDRAALAPILVEAGEFDEAQAILDDALVQVSTRFGESHYEVAVVLHNLGALAGRRGDWVVACAMLGQAAAIKRQVLGPDHPELVSSLFCLRVAADRSGQPGLAAQTHTEALRVAATALPASHPIRRGTDTRRVHGDGGILE